MLNQQKKNKFLNKKKQKAIDEFKKSVEQELKPKKQASFFRKKARKKTKSLDLEVIEKSPAKVFGQKTKKLGKKHKLKKTFFKNAQNKKQKSFQEKLKPI